MFGYFTKSARERIKAAVRWVEGARRVGRQSPRYQSVQTRHPNSTFTVLVYNSGGSAGSISTTCSFVYDVKNLAGDHVYGEDMVPKERLGTLPNVPYITCDEWTEGLGYFDNTGAFKLYSVACERPDTGDVCEDEEEPE